MTTLDLYMANMVGEPMTVEEERVATPDELVKNNMSFAYSMALEYHNKTGIELEDLIQEANMGLIVASEKFKPEKGYKFITYAVWWVKQKMFSYRANGGEMVRIPSNRVKDGDRHQYSSFDREGLDRNKEWFIPSLREVIYDDAPLPDQVVESVERTEQVERILETLPVRTAFILRRYFGFDGDEFTLQGIGDELNLSRERIRQIKAKGLEQFKWRWERRGSGIRDHYGTELELWEQSQALLKGEMT